MSSNCHYSHKGQTGDLRLHRRPGFQKSQNWEQTAPQSSAASLHDVGCKLSRWSGTGTEEFTAIVMTNTRALGGSQMRPESQT